LDVKHNHPSLVDTWPFTAEETFVRDYEENTVLLNTFYENKVDQLRDVAKLFGTAVQIAGIRYQMVGGFAIFCHVDRIDPPAVKPAGMLYRHVAGIDMLVDAEAPRARSAVHLIFVNEKVRPEYIHSVPGISAPDRTADGILIAPVADLLTMKLTSFRLKDQVHIQDLDAVGLITAEIEATLPEVLRERLGKVRASE
jgi:hypothetical protein